MRVLLVGTSLLPSYGGPAFSVSRLAEALAERGAEVCLWAADGSAMNTELIGAGSSVHRLAGDRAVSEAMRAADLVHDNGVWLPHNHRLAQLAGACGRPRVVSTRGMLEPWAMRHKRWKKTLAWRLYQRRDISRAAILHATSLQEQEHLDQLRLDRPVRMIPNGVDVPAAQPIHRGAAVTRTALFLGRIYPVKGLLMLVEAWARARPAGWRLQLAGPDEAGHRAEVERAVAAAGLAEVVSFCGPLDRAAKTAALQAADLFVLPSHSESFGMAVAEALAHGAPVLTTTAVPWPGLTERGCGWRVAPNVAALDEGLRLASAYDTQTLRSMGARGRDWVAEEFTWPGVARQFLALYGEACS